MGVRWHERVFVAGQTGSGKSELLNLLFSRIRCQRVLWDTKPEFEIPGVTPDRDVAQIDWSQPTIHFKDSDGDLAKYNELAYEILHRKHVVSCVHEEADLCEDQPSRTPKWVRALARKGNIRGDGVLGGSQRPVGMPKQLRTETQHLFYMTPKLDPDDHDIVARMFGMTSYGLAEEIKRAAELAPDTDGKYAFLWMDRTQPGRHLTLCPPLPAHLRAQIIVQRTDNISAVSSSTPPDGPTQQQLHAAPEARRLRA